MRQIKNQLDDLFYLLDDLSWEDDIIQAGLHDTFRDASRYILLCSQAG